ncbi:Alpha amylase catalytic region [uncultured Paludibacter sp.]|uniref:Alpha amylase catalytic region n=1 Tax=uncultured Paludibacter sp. TaxID=497635 RepID=A0A653ACG2_9BACT|nr:Alpha amylase catalytic region [uncultured Paludibacter sp.]
MKNKIFFLFVAFSLMAGLAITVVSCKPKSNKISENLLDSIDYKKSTPEWAKNANIYEVNVRQYTPEGTFEAFQKHLPRLKKMGVDILWLMPINPIGEKNRKGTLGSYYAVKDYTAVNPEFGTEGDLKNLVNEAHKLGMKVIIDWVANHTAWDNVWIQPHPDWYTQDSLGKIIIPKGTDWEDTADLNYDNPELRRAMIDAMSYWVKNVDIDGFRCDVAGMVPLSFWLHARKELDEIKPNLFFLAEDGEPIIHRAFDMTYDWPLKDIINDIAQGKKNVTDIIKHFNDESVRFNSEDVRMHFITNHDENTWAGDEYERLKNQQTVDAFTILTYMIPGMPLTYTGQEEPLKKRLKFFDKDTVGFKTYARQELITKLNELRKRNEALWSTDYKTSFKLLNNTAPTDVLSFIRFKGNNKIICVLNLSSKEQTFKITDEIVGDFTNYLGESIMLKTNTEIKLKPWGYSIQVMR